MRRRTVQPPPTALLVRRAARPEFHGGSWKLAYADFVTTMMALFVVLWASSQSPQVRHAIAEYFRHPAVLQTTGAGASVLPKPPTVAGVAAPPTPPAAVGGEEAVFRETAEMLRRLLDTDPELRALC